MKKFIFTFGYGHHQPDGNGGQRKLAAHYTIIEAETEIEARNEMYNLRASKWAFCYPFEDKETHIDKYGLTFIPLEEVLMQEGESLS